ncbi:MAG TPA: rhomboid family intramembrane serine protease [Gemmatimonadales bacterium]|jgi:membrane associated rhomboid family serine protease|nr:rhomboid family intramembrane serine protease [Gemmatimonadales bacterium]
MSTPMFPRLTPVVGRLIAANAVVQLLMSTVLTSARVEELLRFSPDTAFRYPWTFVTYFFVHGGLLHLATNMLALYVFGTPVEARWGSRKFTLYYFYCGIGAAVFSLMLAAVQVTTAPFVGASGAILGVALAFAMLWPDEEIIVFPVPIPIRARTLVIALAALNTFFAVWRPDDGVAHLAHLGGLLFGYLFFRFQRLSERRAPVRARLESVAVQSGTREGQSHTPASLRTLPRSGGDPVAAEVDRVLDKISAHGIGSLTAEERRFLDEVSKRKQREVN